MKTAHLIEAIASDAKSKPRRLRPALGLALGASALVTGLMFSVLLGPRADIAAAADTSRFMMKFVVTGAFGLAAAVLAVRLARPGDGARPGLPLLIFAAAVLVGAVGVELMSVPAQDWAARLYGRNWLRCLGLIPLLSAPPLVLLLLAMRRGAPDSPARLGAASGLLAGAVGATFYAFHCTDDSPLFIGAWYVLAMGVVTAIGAAIGSRLLRW